MESWRLGGAAGLSVAQCLTVMDLGTATREHLLQIIAEQQRVIEQLQIRIADLEQIRERVRASPVANADETGGGRMGTTGTCGRSVRRRSGTSSEAVGRKRWWTRCWGRPSARCW